MHGYSKQVMASANGERDVESQIQVGGNPRALEQTGRQPCRYDLRGCEQKQPSLGQMEGRNWVRVRSESVVGLCRPAPGQLASTDAAAGGALDGALEAAAPSVCGCSGGTLGVAPAAPLVPDAAVVVAPVVHPGMAETVGQVEGEGGRGREGTLHQCRLAPGSHPLRLCPVRWGCLA